MWQIRQVNHFYKLNLEAILYKVIFSDAYSLRIHACGDMHEKGNWVGKNPLKRGMTVSLFTKLGHWK